MACLNIPYHIFEVPVVETEISSLGGEEKKKLNCILDTGATMTTIPQKDIDELRIIPSGSFNDVMDWNGNITLEFWYAIKVFLCGRELKLGL